MPANGKKATKKSAPKRVAPAATKKKVRSGVVGIAMIALALVLSVGTYAYYRTQTTGTITGSILEWNCTAGGSNQNFTLSLGDLYPGKTGSWPIALTVTNFDADFTIGIDPTSVANVDNVVFYHGSTELCKGDGTDSANCVNTYTERVNGATAANGAGTGTTTITYEWPIDSAQNTNLPSETVEGSSTVNITIVCSQRETTPYTGTGA